MSPAALRVTKVTSNAAAIIITRVHGTPRSPVRRYVLPRRRPVHAVVQPPAPHHRAALDLLTVFISHPSGVLRETLRLFDSIRSHRTPVQGHRDQRGAPDEHLGGHAVDQRAVHVEHPEPGKCAEGWIDGANRVIARVQLFQRRAFGNSVGQRREGVARDAEFLQLDE